MTLGFEVGSAWVKRAAACLPFAALAVLLSCSTLPIPDPSYVGVYGAALKKATRRATIYEGLETRAFVRATYLSPEFTAAQAAEISRIRGEPPSEAATRLAKMLDENKVPSFFVALHTPVKEWNDWDEPKSVWRIAVDLGHGQIDAPKVVRVERPDAEMLALYPYWDTFSIGYFLRFTGDPQPAPSGSVTGGTMSAALGRMQFVAAGALGRLNLEWTLPGFPAAAAAAAK